MDGVCLRYIGREEGYCIQFQQVVHPGEFIRDYPDVPGDLSDPLVRAAWPCRIIPPALAEAMSNAGPWEIVPPDDAPEPEPLPEYEPITDADGEAIAAAILNEEE